MQGRVLIADDNPVVRKTLRQLLEGAALGEILEAEDGQAAVSRAIESCPEVIILDLAMPVMDGLNAAREISRALPEAAILMYTMHWSTQLELEAKKCGVRMLVSKTQGTVLLAAIQEMMGAKQTELQSAKIPAVTSTTQSLDMVSTMSTPSADGPTNPSPAASETQKFGATDTPAKRPSDH
jgi:DNA-binding NarL/FixJ family response regulator